MFEHKAVELRISSRDRVLNKMSKDGWELVGVETDHGSFHQTHIGFFKREIPKP